MVEKGWCGKNLRGGSNFILGLAVFLSKFSKTIQGILKFVFGLHWNQKYRYMCFCPLCDLGAHRNYLSSDYFVKVRLSGEAEKKANLLSVHVGQGAK